jgi:hypothetical protein
MLSAGRKPQILLAVGEKSHGRKSKNHQKSHPDVVRFRPKTLFCLVTAHQARSHMQTCAGLETSEGDELQPQNRR